VRYAAFQLEPKFMPAPEQRANLLFITGTKGRPAVTLNNRDVSASLRAWKHEGADGWLVSLTGNFPPDDQITARLLSVQKAISEN
jgi:hypothetical protein